MSYRPLPNIIPIPERVIAALEQARQERGELARFAAETGLYAQTLSKIALRQQTRMEQDRLRELARYLRITL